MSLLLLHQKVSTAPQKKANYALWEIKEIIIMDLLEQNYLNFS